jgi:hypothetical protein
MITSPKFILIIFIVPLGSCITEFIPETNELKELVVIEGLITDQSISNRIKISKSLPLGEKIDARPLTGCIVSITDDSGFVCSLTEGTPGTYYTDSTLFRGRINNKYTLHVALSDGNRLIHYESSAVEMRAVPPVDSIYYEKIVVKEKVDNNFGEDGCQIYLDTHDASNNCRFYRWDFSETWVLRLLFPVDNMTCWISDKSNDIYVQTTEAFSNSRITGFPITYISNITDRLKIKYSISVNQYSLSEEEYEYWKKLKNLTVSVGGLHDVIPSSIPSNIKCVERPDEKVLGYFSVSACSSKRVFIKDEFAGIVDQYPDCIADTIYGEDDSPYLNVSAWTLIDHPRGVGPRERVLTYRKECADCTTRGTNIKPDYWIDK